MNGESLNYPDDLERFLVEQEELGRTREATLGSALAFYAGVIQEVEDRRLVILSKEVDRDGLDCLAMQVLPKRCKVFLQTRGRSTWYKFSL